MPMHLNFAFKWALHISLIVAQSCFKLLLLNIVQDSALLVMYSA